MNQVRKCITNSFYKLIPDRRNRVCLSIIDDIILKFNSNDIEEIIENIHDLRDIILNLLTFEKFIRNEQQTERPDLNEDDDQQKS